MVGNNGFGGSHPLTVTYNAKEQTATQTDTAQYVSPMTFTGRGQFERVSDTDTNGTHTYTYSALGLTKIVGSTATYVRDPSGGLVSQQNVTGGPYYYLSDGQGNVGGMADSSGGQAAGYLNCPTGNTAEAPWGSNPLVNPYRQYGAYYDASFQSYWMNGQQYDANSGNGFQLTGLPDFAQSLLQQAKSLALSLGADAFGVNVTVNAGIGLTGVAGVDILFNLVTQKQANFAMFGGGFGVEGDVAASGLVVFTLPTNSNFAGPFVSVSGGIGPGASVNVRGFTSFPGTGNVYGFSFGPGVGAGVSGAITTDVLLNETDWSGPP